ncbi:amino-acid N-acetyltransferase [Nitrosomonas sp. Nm33]|uniref:amino-acid N-acetyltransferase n=1 Tax=Nitrosomonas sp. Nm33 TaxID=133724 RepID=UPI000897AA39|nr:amino-acid N-acetyltransferase [Nitrosomonas sp. Nm33]SDX88452.1 amino-acid N-acetyltransferase [Nitrosomonas sp. Nm33]
MTRNADFVTWFRSVAPYIKVFRSKTFVIAFGGEVVDDGNFVELVHDFNLLASLGIQLILVHGARPQIEFQLQQHNLEAMYVNGIRVTDNATLQCVKEAVGKVRVEIEALMSMGLPNSPMANAAIHVASGNFVIARPIGVLEGIDLIYSGEVRKINTSVIRTRLENGEIVLLSPLGYSPTGEIFNLTLENVATEVAIALGAEKLIFLMNPLGIMRESTEHRSTLWRELTIAEAKSVQKKFSTPIDLTDDIQLYLPCAIHACGNGVARVHLISRHIEGALLQELFTHEGIGSMITQGPLQTIRKAEIEDIGGILQLIEPLENEGVLVRRSRELLEIEIDHFTVLEHDNMIIACAALYPFPNEGACELACLAVHPHYRKTGCASTLLKHIEQQALAQGYLKLFVLTTRTAHWFIERGFTETTPDKLPKSKQSLYNYQRRSKVFMKQI